MKRLWLNEWCYLEKSGENVNCEEWMWVSRKVFSFCYLDITKVAEFGSGIRARTLG